MAANKLPLLALSLSLLLPARLCTHMPDKSSCVRYGRQLPAAATNSTNPALLLLLLLLLPLLAAQTPAATL
jgi:hypothetical protein